MSLEAARKAARQLEKHASALADAFSAMPPEAERAPFVALSAVGEVESAWRGIEATRALVAEYEPNWRAYRGEAEAVADRHRVAFAGELAGALEGLDWSLRGRLPALELGPLTIELAGAHKPEIRLYFGPRIELLETLPVDAAKVAEAIRRVADELSQPLDGGAFVRELMSAWRAAHARHGGDLRVPVALVIGELALGRQGPAFWANPTRQAFQPLSRVRLAYDLARLTQRSADGLTLVLGVATRDQTKRAADHLWVPNGASLSGTHYAALGFERQDT